MLNTLAFLELYINTSDGLEFLTLLLMSSRTYSDSFLTFVLLLDTVEVLISVVSVVIDINITMPIITMVSNISTSVKPSYFSFLFFFIIALSLCNIHNLLFHLL